MNIFSLGNGDQETHLRSLYVRDGGYETIDPRGNPIWRYNIVQVTPNVAVFGQNSVHDFGTNPANPSRRMVQIVTGLGELEIIRIYLKLSNVVGYNQARGSQTYLKTSVYVKPLNEDLDTQRFDFIIPIAEGNFNRTESDVFFRDYFLAEPLQIPNYAWVTMSLESSSNAACINFNCSIKLTLE